MDALYDVAAIDMPKDVGEDTATADAPSSDGGGLDADADSTDVPLDAVAVDSHPEAADLAGDIAGETAPPTGCVVVSDCPGQDTECAKRTCVQGTCGVATLAPGLPVPLQVAGDCKIRQCDGSAAVVAVPDNFDLPEDGNPCTVDLCTVGTPSHTFAAQGQACGGTNKCNSNGQCVGCNVPADCAGNDTACSTRTCVQAVCGVNLVAAGTAIASQTPGDCKVVQCDGNGNATPANDNNDLPVDGNACTNDVCSVGTPSNPAAPSGTSCGNGRQCDGAGHCGQCNVASDCGTNNDCRTYTCSALGACMVAYQASGTAVPTQATGDCKVAQCDGAGNTMPVNDNNDLPVDGNPCTKDVCTNGTPSNPSEPNTTTCGTNQTCDGSGHCLGCTVAANCGTDSACRTFSCSAQGVCGSTALAQGTVVATQIAHDCKQDQCDGNGNVVTVNFSSDTPVDDGTVCTIEGCSAGMPTTTPASSATVCADHGGTHCDGAGMCVATAAAPTFMVLRIGDGSAIPATEAAPLFVEERKVSDGSLVRTINLPTVANPGNNKVVMLSSSAKSEGGLSLSADKHYLTLGGYAATADMIGKTPAVSISSSAADRVAARISAAGTVETFVLSASAFIGDNLRNVTSTDGVDIWASGNGGTGTSSGGVWYAKFGDTGTEQLHVVGTGAPTNTPTQARICLVTLPGNDIGVATGTMGHLFCSSDKKPFGLFTVGMSPPPKAVLQTTATLAGMAGVTGPSPFAFAFVPPDRLYVADDNVPTATPKGGVQRWRLVNGSWSTAPEATFSTGSVGVRGLAVISTDGSNVTVLATTAASAGSNDGVPNEILKFVDDGSTVPTSTSLVMASSNTFFRGLALPAQ